jgi:hypothetical protein
MIYDDREWTGLIWVTKCSDEQSWRMLQKKNLQENKNTVLKYDFACIMTFCRNRYEQIMVRGTKAALGYVVKL